MIYVTTGDQFLKEARISAQRVNDVCPGIPISLFTDLDRSLPEFENTCSISYPIFGFGDKIKAILKSPHHRTVYLDGDTYLHDPAGLYDLFDILEEFDIAASHDTARFEPADGTLKEAYEEGIPEAFSMFNGGVIAFRLSDNVESMFRDYLERYRKHRSVDQDAADQPAMRGALYESDIRIATLPPEYNFRIPYPQCVYRKVKLFYGRAENIEEVVNKFNEDWQNDHPRIYVPAHVGFTQGLREGYTEVRPLMNPRRVKMTTTKLSMSVQEYGILRTAVHHLMGGGTLGRGRYKTLANSISERGLIETSKEILRWLQTGEFKDNY